MISVRNVSKLYDNTPAIEEITLSIDRGSILGLVGYNGAGKTTLLKTICGIFQADKGDVLVDGESIYDNPRVKANVFLVADEPYIIPQASMKRMSNFYRGYYHKWSDDLFGKLATLMDLDIAMRMSSFSKGMLRQASIIFALSSQPDFLLLDESFDGIDPAMRDIIKQLLLQMISEKGTGIIISSHNLRELENLCDHICIINGRKIAVNTSMTKIQMYHNKVVVAFNEEYDQGFFNSIAIDYSDWKANGKLLQFIAHGDPDEIRQKLMKLCPTLIEFVPLTLEEIFLSEMEARKYDISNIFDS